MRAPLVPFLTRDDDDDAIPQQVNPRRTLSIQNKLQSILAADPSLKYLAQKVCCRLFLSTAAYCSGYGCLAHSPVVCAMLCLHCQAFVSYMRSVFLQPAKDVFDVNALPAEQFSLSLGLLSSPRIRFTQVRTHRLPTEERTRQ
jgi:hypothetical protein